MKKKPRRLPGLVPIHLMAALATAALPPTQRVEQGPDELRLTGTVQPGRPSRLNTMPKGSPFSLATATGADLDRIATDFTRRTS